MRLHGTLSPVVGLVLAAVLTPALWADVLVVDAAGGPGSDFTNLQAAVTAAADGDTLLLRDGTYAPIQIVGKGLNVLADGDDVHVNFFVSGAGASSSISVSSLGASQQVVLRGLQCNFGVRVDTCAGTVWLDEIVVTGGASLCPSAVPGARILESSDVIVTNCSLRGELGNDGWNTSTTPGAGLLATGSTVQLWDTALEGGWGNDEYTFFGTLPPQPGAPGLLLQDSLVTVYGGTIFGGEGGLDSPVCGGEHAIGGPGVRFADAASTLRRCDTTIGGGQANLFPLCPGETGPAGPAVDGTGAIVDLPGAARGLRATSPVRSGELLSFDVTGMPGEIPVLFVSTVQETVPVDPFGVLVVEIPPAEILVLDALPASGHGSLSFAAPAIGGRTSARYYVQVLAVAPGPAVQLGAGSTVFVLDPAF